MSINPDETHWDLSNYFANEKEFKQKLKSLELDCITFSKVKGYLFDSPDSLLNHIDEYFKNINIDIMYGFNNQTLENLKTYIEVR